MKNALLILFMLLLPWQTITAAKRNFMHVTGSQQSEAYFVKHLTEHIELVMHHHDEDDDGVVAHDDATQKSARHLADFDQGLCFNVLIPAPHAVAVLPAVRIAPVVRPDSFADRTTLPLRRPPRVLA